MGSLYRAIRFSDHFGGSLWWHCASRHLPTLADAQPGDVSRGTGDVRCLSSSSMMKKADNKRGELDRTRDGEGAQDAANQIAGSLIKDLIAAIEASGTTPYAIAKRSGISKSTLSKFLLGTRPNLTIDTIAKLCVHLGLTIKLERTAPEDRPFS
jgi:DNA-binding Xre family transcriptional regulator